ncbi:cell division protein FtsQ/DivIB [Sphingomonas sp. FW199]|uniref:cell division protein FtsQ/DivIB n=1 Tax=Sphingomonas sp. FW199 TaxID=3400217 RepID=UPI003CE7F4AA
MARQSTRRVANRPPVKPKRKPQTARTPRAGILDHAVAALPGGQDTVRRVAAWTITGVVLAGMLMLASATGVIAGVTSAMGDGMAAMGLRVKSFELIGARRIDQAAVYAVLATQESKPLPMVDLAHLRELLLQEGWIADAQVSRRYPDALVVRITERKPAAIWQSNGQLMLIDAAGTPLQPLDPNELPDLPMVVGESANDHFDDYQRLIAAAPALKPMVRAANWVGDRRWTLTFVSGERLMLPEGTRESAAALVKFAEWDGTTGLLGRGHRHFDMRDVTRLVIQRGSGDVSTRLVDEAAD